MESYKEMMERHQAEVNAFPFGFAFSEEQFRKMMEGWGLKEDDTDMIYRIPGGGFVQKKDHKAMHEMFSRHETEMKNAIDADTDGSGFVYQMFRQELADHEFGYTGDVDDTIESLGFTREEIRSTPKLLNALRRAAKDVAGMKVIV